MNPDTKAILDALLESRQILEAKLQGMDTKLEAVAATSQPSRSSLLT